jgi:hypothetical protein
VLAVRGEDIDLAPGHLLMGAFRAVVHRSCCPLTPYYRLHSHSLVFFLICFFASFPFYGLICVSVKEYGRTHPFFSVSLWACWARTSADS